MTPNGACPTCGGPVAPGGGVCGRCGDRLAWSCLRCGIAYPSSPRFCPDCGRAFGAPDSHGERRLLTILFADIEGFVAATAGLDPEAVAELTNRYFARVAEAVDRFGGTIATSMGDAVMALFGAPTAHEDDAERAIHAALAIQDRLREMRETAVGDRRIALRSRIGIATGEALYGAVGLPGHAVMTALGETVALAARLERVAPAGGVLVSEATYRLTTHRFAFLPPSQIQLAGFAAPITAYLVRGEVGAAASGGGAAGSGGSFVGRRRELARARHALRSARRGKTTALEILGEAGIGKSRFVAELIAAAGEATVISGQSSPYDQAAPFGLVRGLVRKLLSPETPFPAEIDGDEREVLAALREESAVPQPVLERPMDETAQTAGAALAKLLGRPAPSLVVLIAEDLQWADQLSLLALRSLVERVPDAQLLLVLVSRSGTLDTSTWSPRTRWRRLLLDSLDRAASRTLLLHLVGDGVLSGELERTILDRAAGNPLFVREFVRAVTEGGTRGGLSAGHRPHDLLPSDLIPLSLRGMIAAQIDRLADADRLRLRQAAVLGDCFDGALLAAVTGEEGRLEEHLERLVASGLLSREPDRPGWFAFKRPVVRDVAYGMLPLALRRRLHRAAATALQKSGPPSDRLGELLFHLERDEQWELAAAAACRAAEAAQRRHAPREAIALYGRALAVLERCRGEAAPRQGESGGGSPLPGHDTAEMARIRLARAEVAALVGDYSEAIADLDAAFVLARRDRPLRAALYGQLGEVRERLGRYPEALEALNAGLAELDPTDHPETRARLLSSISFISYLQGDRERAASLAAEALRRGGAGGDHRQSSRDYLALSRADTVSEEPEAAADLARLQHALEEAIVAGDETAAAQLESRLGSTYARRRDLHRSADYLRRGADRWERLGDLAAAAGVLLNLAVVQEHAGDLAAAAASARRGQELFERAGDRCGQAQAMARLGVIAGARAAVGEGIALLEGALELVTSIEARTHYPEYYRRLAELTRAAALPDRMSEAAQAALEWARQIGNRYEEAHAQRLLGLAAARADRQQEATTLLQASLALFEKMGAPREAEQVRRDLAALHPSV
ncbi:MAG: adenylate/guanylate cyclase domain-containing protein [Chloroflexota bacterium]|nr:AAA family ATPase [Dehalococcoidia bacterium]MDW8254421.1 adenylate/guanylate cyclase domain-containing protein [Chloroflexota bacterium]